MASKKIEGSVNIAVLDSKIVSNLCTGLFIIDLSPSVFINAAGVMGAKVKITNPYGAVIKDFGGYDILPPMTGQVGVNIPNQAGNYQFGVYKVEVELTDGDGEVYSLSKNITICQVDKNNKTKKFGNIKAQINGDCANGKVIVQVNKAPAYNGQSAQDEALFYSIEYPTGSGLEPEINIIYPSISVALYEGVYLVKGGVCAEYNFGDNVFVQVPYKIKCEKHIRCLVDLCCIFEKLAAVNAELNSNCSIAHKAELSDIIVDAVGLVTMIEMGNK